MSLWGSISFYLACILNTVVAVFYPFGDDGDEGKHFQFLIRETQTRVAQLVKLVRLSEKVVEPNPSRETFWGTN